MGVFTLSELRIAYTNCTLSLANAEKPQLGALPPLTKCRVDEILPDGRIKVWFGDRYGHMIVAANQITDDYR